MNNLTTAPATFGRRASDRWLTDLLKTVIPDISPVIAKDPVNKQRRHRRSKEELKDAYQRAMIATKTAHPTWSGYRLRNSAKWMVNTRRIV